MRLRFGLVLALLALLLQPALADDRMTIGSDAYVSGGNVSLTGPSPRAAFVSGFIVDVTGSVEQDLGASGFDVNLNAPVGGDVYAAGFSVDVASPVGEDFSAAGFIIHLRDTAAVAGNVRLAAANVTVDGPITGSLVAAGGSIALNGVIGGEAVVTSGKLTFGPTAKIDGTLNYYAASPIDVPASVIPAGRITYHKIEASKALETARDTAERAMPGFWPTLASVIFGFVLVIALIMILGAMLLAFAPRKMDALEDEIATSPVKIMALGLLGLSMAFGLVPVSAMTLIGLPLVPVAIVIAVAVWILGYLVGTYALAMKVFGAFRHRATTMGGRLLVLAAGLIVLALLNFIPIIGWLINLAVILLGVGAITMRAARHLVQEHLPDEADESGKASAAAPARRRKSRKTE